MKIALILLGIIGGTLTLSFTGYSIFASKTEVEFVDKRVDELNSDVKDLRSEIRDDLKVISADVKTILRLRCKDSCVVE